MDKKKDDSVLPEILPVPVQQRSMTDIVFILLYILSFAASIVFIFWNPASSNSADLELKVYNWNSFQFDEKFYYYLIEIGAAIVLGLFLMLVSSQAKIIMVFLIFITFSVLVLIAVFYVINSELSDSMVIYIVFFSLAFVFLVTVILSRRQIQKSSQIISICHLFFQQNKSIILIPTLLGVIWIALLGTHLLSLGGIYIDQVEFNIYLQMGMIYWSHHLIDYWMIESVSIYINHWYYSYVNGRQQNEIMVGVLGKSFATPLTKNFGSLAFGAIFIPITDFINLIARRNNRVNALAHFLYVILYLPLIAVKYFTKFAYSMMSLTGWNLCNSSFKGYSLAYTDMIEQYVPYQYLSEMYIRMCGVFCGAVATLIGYFLIGESQQIYLVSFIAGYLTSKIYLNITQISVNHILYLISLDKKLHNGIARYGPTNFLQIDDNVDASKIQQSQSRLDESHLNNSLNPYSINQPLVNSKPSMSSLQTQTPSNNGQQVNLLTPQSKLPETQQIQQTTRQINNNATIQNQQEKNPQTLSNTHTPQQQQQTFSQLQTSQTNSQLTKPNVMSNKQPDSKFYASEINEDLWRKSPVTQQIDISQVQTHQFKIQENMIEAKRAADDLSKLSIFQIKRSNLDQKTQHHQQSQTLPNTQGFKNQWIELNKYFDYSKYMDVSQAPNITTQPLKK